MDKTQKITLIAATTIAVGSTILFVLGNNARKKKKTAEPEVNDDYMTEILGEFNESYKK